jgi:hypothetical protein
MGLRRASATNGYVPRGDDVDFEQHTVAYLTGGAEDEQQD